MDAFITTISIISATISLLVVTIKAAKENAERDHREFIQLFPLGQPTSNTCGYCGSSHIVKNICKNCGAPLNK